MSVIEVRRQHSRINNNPPHGCQPRLICHQITSETHVAFDHRREGSTSSTDTRRTDISEQSVSTKKRKTENEPVLTPNRAPPGLLVVSHSGSHVSAQGLLFSEPLDGCFMQSVNPKSAAGGKQKQSKTKQNKWHFGASSGAL